MEEELVYGKDYKINDRGIYEPISEKGTIHRLNQDGTLKYWDQISKEIYDLYAILPYDTEEQRSIALNRCLDSEYTKYTKERQQKLDNEVYSELLDENQLKEMRYAKTIFEASFGTVENPDGTYVVDKNAPHVYTASRSFFTQTPFTNQAELVNHENWQKINPGNISVGSLVSPHGLSTGNYLDTLYIRYLHKLKNETLSENGKEYVIPFQHHTTFTGLNEIPMVDKNTIYSRYDVEDPGYKFEVSFNSLIGEYENCIYNGRFGFDNENKLHIPIIYNEDGSVNEQKTNSVIIKMSLLYGQYYKDNSTINNVKGKLESYVNSMSNLFNGLLDQNEENRRATGYHKDFSDTMNRTDYLQATELIGDRYYTDKKGKETEFGKLLLRDFSDDVIKDLYMNITSKQILSYTELNEKDLDTIENNEINAGTLDVITNDERKQQIGTALENAILKEGNSVEFMKKYAAISIGNSNYTSGLVIKFPYEYEKDNKTKIKHIELFIPGNLNQGDSALSKYLSTIDNDPTVLATRKVKAFERRSDNSKIFPRQAIGLCPGFAYNIQYKNNKYYLSFDNDHDNIEMTRDDVITLNSISIKINQLSNAYNNATTDEERAYIAKQASAYLDSYTHKPLNLRNNNLHKEKYYTVSEFITLMEDGGSKGYGPKSHQVKRYADKYKNDIFNEITNHKFK